ncbi:MAG: hypothetical protein WBG46_02390 [Nonlabens sp.]
MKLNQFIYWISKVFFYLFAAFFLFLLVFAILGICEFFLGWNIPFVEAIDHKNKTMIHVTIPFTGVGVGFPPNGIVILPLLIFGFYTFYLYRMQKFFQVFAHDQSFTKENLKRLKIFYLVNIVIVTIAAIATLIEWCYDWRIKMDESILIVVIHAFVAFLIKFYIDLSVKGLHLQNENDLTI